MTAIEQLLHDAMAEHTDRVPHLRPGTARAVLRRCHRASRVRLAAVTTATVAATAGVGVFAVSVQPATTGTFSGGAPASGVNVSGTVSTPVAVVKSAPQPLANVPPAAGTVDAAAPGADDTMEMEKTAAEAPADLVAVTIADQAAGLDLTPDHGGSYALTLSGKWRKYVHFSKPGAAPDFTSGTIILTKGAEAPLWNGASPSPSINALTVAGRAATNWVSGGDHYVSFTAGALTVQVYSSDTTITTDQLVALGNALQGLPQ